MNGGVSNRFDYALSMFGILFYQKNTPQCKPFFAIAGDAILFHSLEDNHGMKIACRVPDRIVSKSGWARSDGAPLYESCLEACSPSTSDTKTFDLSQDGRKALQARSFKKSVPEMLFPNFITGTERSIGKR